jgi:rhodanese-related sulfurtransferase
METIAFALAILALISAWSMRARLSKLQDELASLRSATPGANPPDATHAAQEIDLNRRFLARLAAGEALDPEQIREGRAWTDVSPRAGETMVADGVRLLDVRRADEVAAGVIPGAQWIPVDELPERVGELTRDQAPMLIYCAAGVRSAAACEYLTEQGFDGLWNLAGGFSSWSGPKGKLTS